jgi:aspartyl/asparaginyl beta-hydroxylase (cupin superfamily)
LKVAPPEPLWPLALLPQLKHARDFSARSGDELAAFAARELAERLPPLPRPVAERWHEAVSILVGNTKPYHAVVNQLCVPRLPSIPFFERAQIPLIAALDAKTDVIRRELEDVREAARDEFVPYILYAAGEPVNQWGERNHSRKWSTLHLVRNGKPVAENLTRCPATAKALAALPLVEIDGLCPNAMFSALAPHSHIPPHHGETNARVVAHLPLIVPDNCRYRVGFEQRRWRVGETLIFDDTIEHEAHNDSGELRVVLIFDLWNPLLDPAERELVQTLAAAARTFAAGGAAPG